jgi:hypothetical protein
MINLFEKKYTRIAYIFVVINISLLLQPPASVYSQEEKYLSDYKCELVSNRTSSLIREINTRFTNYKKRQDVVKQEIENAIVYFHNNSQKKDSIKVYRDKYLEILNSYQENFQNFLFDLADFRDISCQLSLSEHQNRIKNIWQKAEELNSESLEMSSTIDQLIIEIKK